MALVARFASNSKRRKGRPRRLRSLAFVPTLMTLGNLLCGFAAVHFGLRAMYDLGAGIEPASGNLLPGSILERMLPSFVSVGAGLILLGMCLDLFDGLIARVTRSTTNFGGQLDSLADVVTFGVAPATLMVAFMTIALSEDAIFPSPISEHVLGRVTWVSAALYVACTAIRLARFNVEHAKADFDHRTFRGLPSPGAAGIMAAIVVFQEQPAGAAIKGAVTYGMPFVAASLALLMVSRVPYRRLHRTYLLGRQPFGQFVFLLLLLTVFFSYKAVTMLMIALWYGASGPFLLLVKRTRDRSSGSSDSSTADPMSQRKGA